MSGLEDRLSLDISEALAEVARLDDAVAAVGTTLQQSFDAAVSDISAQATSLTVEADTSEITPAIDDAIGAADTGIAVEADTAGLTESIDTAIDAADSQVEITADTTHAQEAIDALSGAAVDVDVQAVGAEAAAESLDQVTTSSHAAGESAGHATEQFAALGVGSKLAAGELGALSEGLHLTGGAGATAAAGIAGFAIIGKELISNAVDARSAQERFNLVLGESAEAVEHIDIGGLNEDLDAFSTRLGSTGVEVENAASKIFTIGTAAGAARPQLEETTKQVLALAGRAVALNPALGNVGDTAERLFTGLARGGRFAANFGISLTSAEINARALADTGKAVASDLTVYEKAAAGAALATERLGTSLSTDVNAGAENIQIKLQAVKARFEEALESLGQPLLDPLLEGITKAEPSLEHLAASFAAVLPPLIDIASAVADGLAPAIEGLVPVAEALGTALGAVADVLKIIPAPLKSAAVGFVAINLAVKALAGSSLVSAAAGFSGLASAAGLVSSAVLPVTVALTATVSTMAFLKSQAKQTDDAVSDFLSGVGSQIQGTQNLEQLDDLLGQIHEKADAERAAAAKNRGGLLGDFGTRGETRGFDEAAAGLTSLDDAGQRILRTGRDLQKQFGLTSEAALSLARGGEASIKAFEQQSDVAAQLSADQKAAQRSTEDFWLAAQTGALSSSDIVSRADATGVAFEDLAKEVSDARQPIIDFATQVAQALPGVATAFDDLADNQGLHTFLKNAQEDVAAAAAFVGNLDTLISRGATNLATTLEGLAKSDPAKAARLAQEAVKESATQLGQDEAKAAGLSFQETFVSFATQNVTDKLNGGLQLEFERTQAAIGQRLQNLPGQVEPQGKETGAGIIGNVIVSMRETLDKIFPAGDGNPLHSVGVEGGKALVQGVADGVGEEQLAALLDPEIQRLKQQTLDIFNKVFIIHSPSEVTKEIGRLVALGFFAGLADTSGAAQAINPILDVVQEFGLHAEQISQAAGGSIDEITASLKSLGEESQKITPDQLLKVGDAVKALGGSSGVKDLQRALSQQVSAAFGGLGGKEISNIVDQLNTQAALSRASAVFGVTPTLPEAFATNVVKGQDVTARNEITQNITVTPPDDSTPSEIAGEIATASAWAFAGVTG